MAYYSLVASLATLQIGDEPPFSTEEYINTCAQWVTEREELILRKVLLAESAGLGHGLAEAVEATVVPLAANYDAILTPASTDGKNFAPRIAAKLDVAPISDIVEVVSADMYQAVSNR